MAADVKVSFEEANFTSLPSQTNIYGLTSVRDESETSKVLVSSLKGKVFLVEFGNKWDNRVSRELPFTYIPAGDAEIVSIDSFVQPKAAKGHGLVVGISLILFNVHGNHTMCLPVQLFWNIVSDVTDSAGSVQRLHGWTNNAISLLEVVSQATSWRSTAHHVSEPVIKLHLHFVNWQATILSLATSTYNFDGTSPSSSSDDDD